MCSPSSMAFDFRQIKKKSNMKFKVVNIHVNTRNIKPLTSCFTAYQNSLTANLGLCNPTSNFIIVKIGLYMSNPT